VSTIVILAAKNKVFDQGKL